MKGVFSMYENTKKRFFHKPTKRTLIISLIIILAAVLLCFIIGHVCGGNLFGDFMKGRDISFTVIHQDKIPKTIEKDVIPEYRDLERALGCLVDGKVYVVVTRGEKPTAGYDLSIEKMKMEKTDKGDNLVVTALFSEPPEGEAVSRIITYPYSVAETELTALPETIELNVRFAE